jgi:hypothetical protein
MTSSSPYAAFRAEEWMRASMIRPRKVFTPACTSTSAADRRSASVPVSGAPNRRPSIVQGELFLFPVIVGL